MGSSQEGSCLAVRQKDLEHRADRNHMGSMQTHAWPPALQTPPPPPPPPDTQGRQTAATDRRKNGRWASQATPTYLQKKRGPEVKMKIPVSPLDQGPHTSKRITCFNPKTQRNLDPLTKEWALPMAGPACCPNCQKPVLSSCGPVPRGWLRMAGRC